MATIKRCFVICPIGDEGSEIRQRADDLFDLLIQPALEVFGFAVTRADKIVGSGQIGNEVIELVQNAELCIMDLTGDNANVFYECGRRHETLRPYIQLIKQGGTLPFDLAGVRTLEYDLTNPRSIRNRIDDIRKHVSTLEENGYAATGSGVTITTLAQAIDRLGRKVDQLANGGYGGGTPAGGVSHAIPVGVGLEGVLRNPNEAFLDSITTGNIEQAAIAFQQIRRVSNDAERIVTYGGLLATQGRREGAAALADMLADGGPDLDNDTFAVGISGLVHFYSITDTEAEGIGVVTPLVESRLATNADPSFKARLLNSLQMMHWGAKDYDEALKYGLESIDLNPNETAYKYNVSMIYEAKGMLEEAEGLVDEFMAQDDPGDADHLGQAIDIYLARGRDEDVRLCFGQLLELDPVKAHRKRVFDEDLRRVLAG